MFKNLTIFYKLLFSTGAVLAACSITSFMLIGQLFSVSAVLDSVVDSATFSSTKQQLMSDVSHAILLTVASLSTGAVGIVISSLYVKRLVVKPITCARDAAVKIANRDLTSVIQPDSSDETGELLTALGAMQDALRSNLEDVQRASEWIRTAAAEVSSGANDLAHRTEATAANLQQSSATMRSLTEAVVKNGESASEVIVLAASAIEAVSKGGEAVQRVVASMDEIRAASKKISDIIGVIDGIAFQTNILALNAAVEAARAGEQGRGFAVVAGEVRHLSARSAEAAREIRALILGSVEKVEFGAKQVCEAGISMSGISEAVTELSKLVDVIANTSTSQGRDINHVASTVENVEEMTQQNAALVEQSAAAAESLNRQSLSLNNVVSAFRIHA